MKILDVKNSNGLIKDLLTVGYYNEAGVLSFQVVDQRPVVSNAYRLPIANWQKIRKAERPPSQGPYTIRATQSTNFFGMPKPGGGYMSLLNTQWADFIKAHNSVKAWERIAAPDYGPSQGYNGNGLLKYLSLAYPHPDNVVRVKTVRLGVDGQSYALLETIPFTSVPGANINPTDTPWLWHLVYNWGYMPIVCPLIGVMWIPAAYLVKA
jgi:hypothetical protein